MTPVLFAIAAILAIIALAQSRLQSLIAWSVLAIAVGLLIPRL